MVRGISGINAPCGIILADDSLQIRLPDTVNWVAFVLLVFIGAGIEIIRILMEEWQYNMTQAMEIYYNSDTFERLSDPTTGLYYQSAGYVYDFLKKELTTGQVS